jgi:diacylglycerol kinase family enzyme
MQGREITFHADRPFAAYADGDPVADLPATVRVRPGALRVIVPGKPGIASSLREHRGEAAP